VPRWIGRILLQEGARFRNGKRCAILLEEPRALVVVLRGVGGQADIRERATQQMIAIGGVRLGDLRVERKTTPTKCGTFSSKSDAATAKRGVPRKGNVFWAISKSCANAAEPGVGGGGTRARLFGRFVGGQLSTVCQIIARRTLEA